MGKQTLDELPDSKFNPDDYITDGEGQSFEVAFVEYDFEREEYYYLPLRGEYAGKIYEPNAKKAVPSKSSAMETYELLFGKSEEE